MLGYDQETGASGTYTVTNVMVHTDTAIIDLTIDGERVETTPTHLFYTQEYGWVSAGALWQGAHVRKADGSYGTVEAAKTAQRSQPMYDLTLDTAHTFFVGADKFLVHNVNIDSNNCLSGITGAEKQLLPPEGSPQRQVFTDRDNGVSYGTDRNFPEAIRKRVDAVGDTFGCHTCGSAISRWPSGRWTPDHWPPISTVEPNANVLLFPHCKTCSLSQRDLANAYKKAVDKGQATQNELDDDDMFARLIKGRWGAVR